MRQILEEMEATEIDAWMAFYSIEPWGDHRADIRNALLCNLIHNREIPKEKAHHRTKIQDWLPFKKKEDRGMDAKAIRNFFENVKLQQAQRKEREHNDRSSPH